MMERREAFSHMVFTELFRMRSINKLQISIGFFTLFAGLLLYLLTRPSDIYFVSFIKRVDNSPYWALPFSDGIGGALPSFLHVFAFSLLLGGLMTCRKTGYLMICCAWMFTNVLFELGQRYPIPASQAIPRWFEGMLILQNMRSYFLNGTFDFFDLLASFVGAVAAYSVLVRTGQEGRV
jgi:hypothetical protein